VEDEAEGLAVAGMEGADAVAHRDAVIAARTLGRAMVNREDDGFALAQGDDFTFRLGARPLLDQEELAAGEVVLRVAQQDRQLQREDQGP
jgi:hypothetical protein